MTSAIAASIVLAATLAAASDDTITTLTVSPQHRLQTLDGMGCGAIFYEGHMISLAARNKHADQEQLYDDMFAKVRTDFLHLMIRHDHEPQNDNADPYDPQFKDEWFAYVTHPDSFPARCRCRPCASAVWELRPA